MERSADRRRAAGRRAEDRRHAGIARRLEHDLTAVSDLVESIRADPDLPEFALRRLQAVDRELTRIIEVAREAAPVSQEAAEVHQLATHLTRREWECLDLLVQGMTTGAIAAGMGVSTTTVRTHVQSLLAKLGVHSRLQAVALTTRTALLAAAPKGVGRQLPGASRAR